MVATEVLGMVNISLAGLLLVGVNTLSTEAARFGLPFFYLYGVGSVLVGAVSAAALLWHGVCSKMGAACWKWVALRGVFGTSSFCAALLAISLGSPVGDTSALSCINVVLSALLGRAFLGEPLRGLHALALLASVVGAVLVSRPEFLFGGSSNGVPLAGYGMALASAVLSSLTFVSARMVQSVNPSVMTTFVMFVEGTTCVILPQAGLVDELPLGVLLESPPRTAVALALFGLLSILASITLSLGSQMCPAAASSTIFSASSLALGYSLQTVLHGEAPQIVTLSGAFMMLLAVVLMSLARWVYSPQAEAESDSVCAVDSSARGQDADSVASDSNFSLASFVASEVSGVGGHVGPRLRQRAAATAAAAAAAAPAATSLGLASA